ncbi:MAG: transglycosylase domain-containing protein [Oscillospiraceae bacterium]
MAEENKEKSGQSTQKNAGQKKKAASGKASAAKKGTVKRPAPKKSVSSGKNKKKEEPVKPSEEQKAQVDTVVLQEQGAEIKEDAAVVQPVSFKKEEAAEAPQKAEADLAEATPQKEDNIKPAENEKDEPKAEIADAKAPKAEPVAEETVQPADEPVVLAQEIEAKVEAAADEAVNENELPVQPEAVLPNVEEQPALVIAEQPVNTEEAPPVIPARESSVKKYAVAFGAGVKGLFGKAKALVQDAFPPKQNKTETPAELPHAESVQQAEILQEPMAEPISEPVAEPAALAQTEEPAAVAVAPPEAEAEQAPLVIEDAAAEQEEQTQEQEPLVDDGEYAPYQEGEYYDEGTYPQEDYYYEDGEYPEQPYEEGEAVDGETMVAAAATDASGEIDAAAGKGKKKKKEKKEKKRSVVGLVFLNLFKALFVVFCAVIVAGCVAAVSISTYLVGVTASDDTLLDLDNLELAQTSYIYALNPANENAKEENDWIEYQELISPQIHRIWAPLDTIPQDMKNAVMAIEDRNFESHHGFNLGRTAYAMLNEIFKFDSNTFGASTLDQQLVRNLTEDRVVTGEDGDKTDGYLRKLREIYRAWNLNNNYSKQTIMEAYLNTMGLSERNVGVQAGANAYFGKDISDLTLWECATIAGITQYPSYYSPVTHPERALARRDSVLYQMYETGYITEAEYKNAIAQPLGLSNSGEDPAVDEIYDYFTDAVVEDVLSDLMEHFGYTRAEATNYLYTAGLRIYATVDADMQSYVSDYYAHALDEDGYFGSRAGFYNRFAVEETDADGNTKTVYPESAITIIDYDGELKAVAGGLGEKTESLGLNRATQSPRQTGSTMKPVAAYSLGIDMGVTNYGDVIPDSPVSYRVYKGSLTPFNGGGPYDWPHNYSRSWSNQGVPVVSAVSSSLNTIAANVGMRVGAETMFEFARDTLEISTLVDPADNNGVGDVGIGPMALGMLTKGITTYEMAGAYMMFGNGGVHTTLHTYTKITDAAGNTIMKPVITSVQAISEDAAYVMNRMLWTVLRRGAAPGASATAAGYALNYMDSVAKTGTTDDHKDYWFMGLTPYYVCSVWWGYDNNHPLLTRGYSRWFAPSGIWKEIMEHVQEDLPEKDFPAQPDGVTRRAFCTITGDLAAPGCPSAMGYYTDAYTPNVCTGHEGYITEGEEQPPA